MTQEELTMRIEEVKILRDYAQNHVKVTSKELESLEAQLKELEVKWWEPKVGENCYAVDMLNKVCSYTNTKEEFDIAQIALGNCYRTEQDAERAKARRIAETKVRKFMAENGAGKFVVGVSNSIPFWDYRGNRFKAVSGYKQIQKALTFLNSQDESITQKLIDLYTPELKLIMEIEG